MTQTLPPEDPGYCGVAPLETGPDDPFWKRACQPHDAAFDSLASGIDDPNTANLEAFGNFAKDIGIGMAQGAFMLTAGIPYLIVGGVGGMFRWAWLQATKDDYDKPEEETGKDDKIGG